MRTRVAIVVAAVCAAFLVPVPAAADRPSGLGRILLTSTAEPATSQFVSWSRTEPRTGQRVVTVAPDGTVRTTAAKRKLGTTKRTAGSNHARYVAKVTGLRPSTTYRYRIVSGGDATVWRTFRTAGRARDSFTFLQFGDTQVRNAKVPARIIDRATRRHRGARLVLQAGDVVDRPWSGREWADLHRAINPSGQYRSWISSIGNHEQCVGAGSCRSGNARGFRSYFHAPSNGHPGQRRTWYFADHGPARIIVLDTYGKDLARQRDFLVKALRTNQRPWSIVLMHRGPFAARDDRSNAEVRRWFLKPLERHGADLVLSGHDHSYARARKAGVTYLTSVSGPKYYDTSAQDFRDNGAIRRRAAYRTSTYQAVTVTPRALRVRAFVGHRANGAKPSARVGDVLDSFTLRR